jgi:hypothetical protein
MGGPVGRLNARRDPLICDDVSESLTVRATGCQFGERAAQLLQARRFAEEAVNPPKRAAQPDDDSLRHQPGRPLNVYRENRNTLAWRAFH